MTDPTFPPLFPNLFALLTGPPGCGKDIVINKVVKLILAAQEGMTQGTGFRMGGRSISAKGIVDALADEESEFTYRIREGGQTKTHKFHSILVCVPELGTLIPVYDTRLISIINELYNCSELFEDQIRGRGNNSVVKIQNPHVAMLLGTQPTTLSETFPEQAYRMGFFSRTNIVHTRKTFPKKLFDSSRPNMEPEFPKLASDLRSISLLQGSFKTTPAFEKEMNSFHLDAPRALTHSRFEDYNTRRSLHLFKLSMICAASEGNKLVVDLPHLERARQFLYLAEDTTVNLFDELVTSAGFHHTVEQVLSSSSETITHQELERRLRKTHRPYEIGQIIRSMIGAGDIEEIETKVGLPKYKVNGNVKEKLLN